MKKKLCCIISLLIVLSAFPVLHAFEFLLEGYEAIRLWDTGKAIEAAEKAMKRNPGNAEACKLMGQAQFYNGNYDEALKHLQKACDINPRNNSRKSFLELVKGTRDIIRDYESYESEHFILRLHPRDRILKYYVLDALEKGYEKIGRMLGYKTDVKIIAEIYAKHEDFNFASTLTKKQLEASGAIGICKFNRNMIVSPRCLAFGFRFIDSIVHELTHYMILHVASPDIPLWLNEGIAKYFETTWRSDESLYLSPVFRNVLAKAVEEDEWIEFERMSKGMPGLDNTREVTLAFAEVSAGVDYIITCYGRDKLVSLTRKFRKEKDENRVFKEVLGVSSKEFLKELKEFIEEKDLEVTRGAVLDNFKLKDDEVNELNEYVGVEARGFVRLGNKFRKKKMFQVALIEYKKALKLEPENSVVLNKVGKTYFDMGEVERAEESLRLSLKYNPNAANTYTNLGDLLLSQNNLKAALDVYTHSNNINPFNPVIHKSMGIIYFNLDRKREAIREFKVTRMLAPYDTEVTSWLMHLEKKEEKNEGTGRAE